MPRYKSDPLQGILFANEPVHLRNKALARANQNKQRSEGKLIRDFYSNVPIHLNPQLHSRISRRIQPAITHSSLYKFGSHQFNELQQRLRIKK